MDSNNTFRRKALERILNDSIMNETDEKEKVESKRARRDIERKGIKQYLSNLEESSEDDRGESLIKDINKEKDHIDKTNGSIDQDADKTNTTNTAKKTVLVGGEDIEVSSFVPSNYSVAGWPKERSRDAKLYINIKGQDTNIWPAYYHDKPNGECE